MEEGGEQEGISNLRGLESTGDPHPVSVTQDGPGRVRGAGVSGTPQGVQHLLTCLLQESGRYDGEPRPPRPEDGLLRVAEDREASYCSPPPTGPELSRSAPRSHKADQLDGQVISYLQWLGNEEVPLPVAEEMRVEEARLRSFEKWPACAIIQPASLAQAGFFYTGHLDNVKCFHCDGQLRNWELGDDPWMEHAKWFPRCQYVLQIKGRDYVDRIQELNSGISEAMIQGSSASRTTNSQGMRAAAQLLLLKRERTCKVCMDKEVGVVFLPCGHLVACRDCTSKIQNCPICRTLIRGSVRTFMS
ncbi:baculoviral IAP repeat-containing protein 7-B-like [Narcine bancroftii]|uniref:baculoviral IAP repeat-containing protein 7-B-like n=1 Tax=Narcine bancroftii TaxID=1343680 RepID=UPI0038314B58